MPERCIYCGYRVGDTTDHIVPKYFLKHFKRDGECCNPEINLAPACKWCNRAKSCILYLPTIQNVNGVYVYTPVKYIKSLADWTYKYSDRLLSDAYIQRYGVGTDEVREVVGLYKSGYYDDMYERCEED